MRIDVEELLAVVSLWPLSGRQLAEIRSIATAEPLAAGAWLTRYYGPSPGRVERLEQEFARTCGAKHAIAVNSGTSALIAALAAVGIGPGDDVIVPAYTFIATASAALIAGAVPNVVDVDESLTIDPDDLERRITPRTRAIVPVHMRGRPAQMDKLLSAARRHGLRIVEDVAQACGGTYNGRWLGTLGDVGCFSFGQYKLVNAGEGGMVVTNDDGIAARVRSYHDTAACWRPNRFAAAAMPGELFPGENYRMSELHGAVALSQLEKLAGYLDEHRVYRAGLLGCQTPELIAPLVIAPDHDAAGDVAE